MSCCSGGNLDNRFVITRGVENSFIFTIKANNSTLPMEIKPGDTFTGILKDIATDTVISTKALSVVSELNGQIKLEYSIVETQSMVRERGNKEDRFYLRPVYTLIIVCDTQVNGKFTARVPSVYVE